MLDRPEHPLLLALAFETTFPAPLGTLGAPPSLAPLLRPDAPEVPESVALSPEARETLRKGVRDLLRHTGYKPTGRGKPSSEYLVRAAADPGLPRINAAVDACNAVSLHSALPISVVDLDLTHPPLAIAAAPPETSYVFNASGQEIRVDHLLCLEDTRGPIANAVKDCQATKTSPTTRRTLSILWTPQSDAPHAHATLHWYRTLLESLGATTQET